MVLWKPSCPEIELEAETCLRCMASPSEHKFDRQNSKRQAWGEAHIGDPGFTMEIAPEVAAEVALKGVLFTAAW